MNEEAPDGDIEAPNSPFRKFLFYFGPLLASFHVASYIVGFFSVGAVAKWILEQWFPFTRWIWTQVFEYLNKYFRVPDFNDVEKDALTTVVFFLPLGLYAVFTDKRHPYDHRYRYFALFIGLLFVGVVGVQLVSTVIGAAFDFSQGFLPKTVVGWLASAGIILAMSSVLFENDSSDPFWGVIFGAAVATLMFYFVVLISENIFSLGLTTFLCFIAVLFLSGIAIVRTPYRLSWSLGSLILFILAGLAFELVIILQEIIGNTQA